MGRRLWARIKRQKRISVDVRKAPKGIWEHTNNSAFFFLITFCWANPTTSRRVFLQCRTWSDAAMELLRQLESCKDESVYMECFGVRGFFPPDFLPRCIRCCNEDVDHHPVTHVKAVLHCPGEGENSQQGDQSITGFSWHVLEFRGNTFKIIWNTVHFASTSQGHKPDTQEMSTLLFLSLSLPHHTLYSQGRRKLSHQTCLIQKWLSSDCELNPIHDPELHRCH